jgi:hypothetical protein
MISKKCARCGKNFKVYPYRKGKAKYCSVSCGVIVNMTGSLNPMWNGRRNLMKSGYVRVRVNGKYVYEHRYVMEKKISRKLTKNESVHHINGDRADNKESNLLLFKRKEHDRYETKRRWQERPESFGRRINAATNDSFTSFGDR